MKIAVVHWLAEEKHSAWLNLEVILLPAALVPGMHSDEGVADCQKASVQGSYH